MKKGRMVRNIALIVASGCVFISLRAGAAEPPADLLKKIAATATEAARSRENYTYRQSVTVQEFNNHDMVSGEYREIRDITFSPTGSRYEQPVGQPQNTLAQIELTPQDFADIRNIQPFFLTAETLWQYSGKYKGEETMDGVQCFVESVGPKQILSGQRYFQGTLWVRETDFGVVRSEGQAVPQIDTLHKQNLFPHFTTLWKEVDGKWMFPVETYADDTLFFRDWPQRIRVVIHYLNYKRFGAQSTLTFGDPGAQPPTQAPTGTTPSAEPAH
jgi:hypothetical protein